MTEKLQRMTEVMNKLDEDQQDAVTAYAEGAAYAVERERRKAAAPDADQDRAVS